MADSRPMRVLIVDDEEAMREVLQLRLEEWGYEVQAAGDGGEAQGAVQTFVPDVVISDVVLPDVSGLELLRQLKSGDPHRPVLLITAHGTVEAAVDAMKVGARDFLTKPLDTNKVRSILKSFEADLETRRSSRQRAANLGRDKSRFGLFIGASKSMGEVYRLIDEVATTQASVLVTGESGTGKELAARTIHELSPRVAGPFVAINAAAIPKELMESEIFGHEKGSFTGATGTRQGCFELAHGGTLFLDEIGEMPIALQPKLLRVLEDGKVRRVGGGKELQVDVRVLAATNRDPRAAIEDGKLREDLYYRINVFTLTLPPLRTRHGDVEILAHHFVETFNHKHGTDVEGLRRETLEMLADYAWPGNVRELRNIMERAVVLAKTAWIEPSHLPPYVQRPDAAAGARIVLPLGTSLADAEREVILKTLEHAGNNKAEAARRLGLDVKTIRNKLKAYGIF